MNAATGLWTPSTDLATAFWVPGWTSIRQFKDGATTDDRFAFLTCEPNAEVAAIHPKAIPVTLAELSEWSAWLSADWRQAKALQHPIADGSLQDAT
jgi:putative SOS response-associated peptidase YedK